MRIFKALILSLLSFFVATSCLDNSSGFVKLVYLSVHGGNDVIIDDIDVTQTIVLELSETVPYDVLVQISSDAGENMVNLGGAEITIPSNTISVEHDVIFKAEGFSDVIAETVVISFESFAKDIEVATPKISFELAKPIPDAPVALCEIKLDNKNQIVTRQFSVGDYTSPEHSVLAGSTAYSYQNQTTTATANVFEKDGLSIFFANINSGSTDKYVISAWIDWDRNGLLTDNEKIVLEELEAGELLATQSPVTAAITAPQKSKDGKYFMRISSVSSSETNGGCGVFDNGDVTDISINYTRAKESAVPTLQLVALDKTNVVVDKSNVERVIVIVANKISNEDISMTVSAVSNTDITGDIAQSIIKIPAGELSVEARIVFKSLLFDSAEKVAKVTVTVVATDATIAPQSSIIYDVKGTTVVE